MSKILITGGTGMVGKAILRCLPATKNVVAVGTKDYDLRSLDQVQKMYKTHKPDKVIHLAAKVGGIKTNLEQPVEFFNTNILINTNVLMAAHENDIQNIVSLLSTCVYPDKEYAQYPLTEEQLHNGPPPESNFSYAYSKRMVEVQSRAYRKQYGRNYTTAIPNNIFGIEDDFDFIRGHAVPSIIRKIYEAKFFGTTPVFWGSGTPLREFTYVDDIAGCLIKMIGVTGETYNSVEPCNIGTSEELSIRQITEKVVKVAKYDGEIMWDTSKPDGQFKKTSLSTKIKWEYTSMEEGLKLTYKWFEKNYPNIRGIK